MATLVLRAFREGSHFQSLTSVASKISTSSQSSPTESSTCMLFSSPLSVGFADKIEKFRVPSLVQSLRAGHQPGNCAGPVYGTARYVSVICAGTTPTGSVRILRQLPVDGQDVSSTTLTVTEKIFPKDPTKKCVAVDPRLNLSGASPSIRILCGRCCP